jgi:thiol-disulfide isomerase/thioredoxin
MRTIFLAAFVLLVFACSSRGPETNGTSTTSTTAAQRGPSESPEINITVEGMMDGMAYLIATYADQRYRLDSASVSKGKMLFQRAEPYPSGLLFVLLPDKTAFQMIVDQDQTFSMKTVAGGNNLNKAMQVEGSLDNELLYRTVMFEEQQKLQFDAVNARLRSTPIGTPEYQAVKADQDKLLAERKAYLDNLAKEYPDNLYPKFKIAGQNPELQDVRKPNGTIDTALQVYLYRTQFWEGVDFSDNRLLGTPVIANKLKRYITELTPQNADSIISSTKFLVDQVLDYPEYFKYFTNYVAIYYEPGKTPVMDPNAIFVFIAQNYFTQERAFWTDSVQVAAIQKRASEQQNSLVGKKGPNVKAPGADGQIKELFAIKDPYIVVFMYNPECDHCIEEAPQMVRFQQEWKSRGVQVYAIAIETEDAKWRNFMAKNQMQNLINVFDPTNRSIYATYYVDNTPEIYVLNSDRTIIAKNLKPSQIAEVIERDMRKRK